MEPISGVPELREMFRAASDFYKRRAEWTSFSFSLWEAGINSTKYHPSPLRPGADERQSIWIWSGLVWLNLV